MSDPVRANAPTNVRSRVKVPARRTVPIVSTLGKTIAPIDKTQFPTSGAIDKIQFPTSGAIDKIQSLISEMTGPTTAKIIAIISQTIVLIESTMLISNEPIVWNGVMRFAIK